MKTYLMGVGLLLLLFCAVGTTPASAQGFRGGGPGFHRHNSAIHWSGSVDDRVAVIIQGGSVHSRIRSGNGVNNENIEVRRPLPNRPVTVYLSRVQGRGHVRIVRQPNPQNNFTAVVSVDDPQPGRSFYSFSLNWN